jgi:vacuolar protein sorting-associated protein 35
MDAVKHALEMVSELRVSSLSPKAYYELYMLVFDNLRYFATMLGDAHRTKKINLEELYELVQYSASIVPRLYLMITVASTYLPMKETPAKIILKDLIDMCRGVQHPIRGLFLRHYLSLMTKDYLPDGNVELPTSPLSLSEDKLKSPASATSNRTAPATIPDEIGQVTEAFDQNLQVKQDDAAILPTDDATNASPSLPTEPKPASALPAVNHDPGNVNDSIAFVMQNFIEMNKLWVRLQHQGPTRDKEKREEERKELRILVGTNIVRLSQLEAVDLKMYKVQILPPILDQIVHCRDPIAQEYLMEVIVQVFPDAFHLQTLEEVLATTKLLQPQVNIKQIIVGMIDRLRNFALSHARNQGSEGATEGENAGASPGGIPEDIQLFDVFWAQITQVITARPDLGIQDISSLLLSLIQLSITCYPEKIDYVDQILRFAREQAQKVSGTSDYLHVTTTSNFHAMLLAPLQGDPGSKPTERLNPKEFSIFALFRLPNHGESFRELLALQPYSTRHLLATHISQQLVLHHCRITTEDYLVGLFECIQVLVQDQRDAPLWKNTGQYLEYRRDTQYSSSAEPKDGNDLKKKNDQLEEVAIEQGLVAKFVSLIYNENSNLHFHVRSQEDMIRMKYATPLTPFSPLDLHALFHAAAVGGSKILI